MTAAIHLATTNSFFAAAIGEALEAEGFSLADSRDAALVLWDTDSLETPPETARTLGMGKRRPLDGDAWLETPLPLSRLVRELRRRSAPGKENFLLNARFRLQPQDRLLDFLPTGTAIALTEKECELLAALHAQTTVPRQELLETVWGYRGEVDTHTLETHLHRLRAKIREAAGEEELILTTPAGYGLKT